MRTGTTIVVLALAGCTAPGAGATPARLTTEPPTATTAPAPDPPPDVLLATDRSDVVTIEDGEVFGPWPGIVGLAGRTTISTKDRHVVWSDGAGAARGVAIDGPVGDRISAGELVPLVTDRAEAWVAFGPPSGRAAPSTIAPGRTTTEIVAIAPSGEVIGGALAGNFVPEAFSWQPQDGGAPWLYVLEYLPADAPTHYRVRLLDPNTGELTFPVDLRQKSSSVDTQMAGVSRDQVVATERGFLFTLYRGNHGEDAEYAFIHMLALEGGVWCLLVPDELALASTAGTIAVSPDESTLYAVSANGSIAEYAVEDVLDPQRDPDARRTVDPLADLAGRPAVVVTDELLIVAREREIAWLDRADLSVLATTEAPADVDALALDPATGGLVAAMADRLGIASIGGDVRLVATLPTDGHRVTKIVPG